MSIKKQVLIIGLLISLILQIGCAKHKTGKKLIPESGESISEIYEENTMSSIGRESLEKFSHTHNFGHKVVEMNIEKFIRTEDSELTNQFRKVYNPDVYLYVFPHLSLEEGIPIPGYLTKFSLYSKEYWALPGERTKER